MPLPEENTPWPPPQLTRPYAVMRAHDAWYAGDRAELIESGRRLAEASRHPAHGRRRRFWTRDLPAGQRDTRVHVPLAADMATTSADLLFSEPPALTVDHPAGQRRLEQIIEDGGIHNVLLEAAEICAALGGVYLKADWDLSVAQRPVLAVVHPDSAVPEWRWGELVAVTFWRVVADDTGEILRYLERHEPGRIEAALYQGTHDDLGERVPLTEHPATAPLADGDPATAVVKATGIDQLTAVYVPNMRPNRRLRGEPHGRSDYDGVEDLFDALDETWTSWLRDLRLARSRIIVPQGYLQSRGRGEGAFFDLDREVFEELNMPPTGSPGTGGITVNQFAIRVTEHAATAEQLVRQAVAAAGYSAQTYGLLGNVQATATEVIARERRTFLTRDRKARYWRPQLGRVGEVLLALDRALGFSTVVPARPRVEFGDSVSEDPKTVAQTIDLLHRAEAASTETKVLLLHPDWPRERIKDEVRRILAEAGRQVPDLDDAFRVPPDAPRAA
ncbi:phage portal protein [Spirillospora sp. NPDC048911]|uniref:phage portal protein n=1 Tax=Spirillospora sp. NPDC048911 TaxID=3364527 RepID=UPI0037126392